MNRIKPKDWFYHGQWVQPPLPTDFWLHWCETKSVEQLTQKRLASNVIALESHYYFWKKDYDTFLKKSFLAAQKGNFSYYINYKNITSKAIKDLLYTEQILLKRGSFTAGDLKRFFDSFQELIGPWMAVFPVSEGIEKFLEKQIEKYNLDLKELAPLFQPAHKPWINIQYQEMISFIERLAKRGLLKMLDKNPTLVARQIKCQMPNLFKAMQKHIKRFAWVGTHHFWGSPLTLSKLIREMKREAKNYPFKPHQAKIKPKLPAKVKNLIKIINTLSYWRFRCAEVSDHATFFLRPHLIKVAKKIGLTYKELPWFTIHEITRAFISNKNLDKRIISTRKKGFGIVYINKKEEVITGNKLKLIKNILKEEVKKEVKIIEGTVGNKGFAKGRVHIVTQPKDMTNFKKGEILISPETTPDFVPAMRLAAAIVTDLGGLTSHAAIISREMNTPCIIGTKIATRVLRDGQLVEVDANKGIVRKLS